MLHTHEFKPSGVVLRCRCGAWVPPPRNESGSWDRPARKPKPKSSRSKSRKG